MTMQNKRKNKGSSKILFPSEYLIIDLETTGLNSEFDEIIEIGALKVCNNKIVDTYNSLVKPNQPIDDFISSLTGITNDMVVKSSKIEEVLPSFLDFVGSSIIVGHNVNFDINFIYDNCSKLLNKNFENDFVDTLRISRKLCPDLKHHRLKDMVENFCISIDGEHRAMADCMSTFKCFIALRETAEKQYNSIENFQKTFKKASHKGLDAKSLSTTKTEFDETHPLYKKTCVFTGTLEKMLRREAMQIVLDFGGECGNNVTSKTNYLILGNNDYCSTIKDGKSSKQKKAEQLCLNGNDIDIISENVFYDML